MKNFHKKDCNKNSAKKVEPSEVIESILINAKRFPINIKYVSRMISKRDKDVMNIIDTLIEDDRVVIIQKNGKSCFFYKNNIPIIKNNILELLRKYHINNPYRAGMTRSEIRGNISNKKKQKAIDFDLFDFILEEMAENNEIKFLNNLIFLPDFKKEYNDKEDDITEQKIETIKQLIIEQRLRKINVTILSNKLDVNKKEIWNILGIMQTRGIIVKIDNEQFVETDDFEDVKRKLVEKFGISRSLRMSEITKILNAPRRFVVPIMEYLDSINFTRRIENERILCE